MLRPCLGLDWVFICSLGDGDLCPQHLFPAAHPRAMFPAVTSPPLPAFLSACFHRCWVGRMSQDRALVISALLLKVPNLLRFRSALTFSAPHQWLVAVLGPLVQRGPSHCFPLLRGGKDFAKSPLGTDLQSLLQISSVSVFQAPTSSRFIFFLFFFLQHPGSVFAAVVSQLCGTGGCDLAVFPLSSKPVNCPAVSNQQTRSAFFFLSFSHDLSFLPEEGKRD